MLCTPPRNEASPRRDCGSIQRPAADAVLLVLAVAASTACGPQPEAVEATAVRELGSGAPGAIYRVELAPGERHEWVADLVAHEMLHVTVFQEGVDVTVALLGPAGERLLWVDSPTGTSGSEEILAIAAKRGAHRLEVAGIGRSGGFYRLRVEARRLADDRDRRRAALFAAFAEAERLRLDGGATAAAGAVPLYRAAIDHARSLGDEGRRHALALMGLGRVLVAAGEPASGVERLAEAAGLLAAAGLEVEAARARRDQGNALGQLGRVEEAEAALVAARAAFGDLDHAAGEAAAINDLGLLAQAVGDLDRARELYEAAIERRRDAGLDESHAPLHNLGEVYGRIGYTEEALDHLERALALERSRGDQAAEVDTLRWIGWLRAIDLDPEQSLDWYDRAEVLARSLDDPRRLAQVLIGRGTSRLALGRVEAAAGDQRLAAELAQRAGDPTLQRLALQNLALAELERGRYSEVRRWVEEARAVAGGPLDPEHEALAQLALAEAERRSGNLHGSLERLEAAVAGFEAGRSRLDGLRSRMLYLSSRRSVYDRLVSVLMALDAGEGGYAGLAMWASERSRARGLEEALTEATHGVRDAATGAMRSRELRLLDRIEELERGRLAPLEGLTVAPPAAGTSGEIRRLWLEVEEVRREMRALLPMPPPTALTLPELLALADGETQVLVYHLARGRSWLWIVDGAEAVTPVGLGDRGEIEAVARQALEALGLSDFRVHALEAERAMRRLSELVLRPALPHLTAPRLVIVPDGALHSIPFGALPMGVDSGATADEPLLSAHEIAVVPSATVLAIQRRRLSGRPPAPGLVAVVADPVYAGDDPRLGGGIGSAEPQSRELTRAVRDLGLRSLDRLPGTADEARAILDLAPRSARSFAALGFEASRTLVDHRLLGGYQVIHFACHGLLHPTQPELSGLVLSLVGPDGRRRDGFVRSHELRDLRLDAELVVLSACSTGRGPQLPGEGVLALPRDLFYAGARSVIASYWDVDDWATAELMSRFYRALWHDGRAPAAALRQAQLALRADPRWRAPAYWAGFTLLGDPRPAAVPNATRASSLPETRSPTAAFGRADSPGAGRTTRGGM